MFFWTLFSIFQPLNILQTTSNAKLRQCIVIMDVVERVLSTATTDVWQKLWEKNAIAMKISCLWSTLNYRSTQFRIKNERLQRSICTKLRLDRLILHVSNGILYKILENALCIIMMLKLSIETWKHMPVILGPSLKKILEELNSKCWEKWLVLIDFWEPSSSQVCVTI